LNPLLRLLSDRLPPRWRRSVGSLRTQLILGNVLSLTLLLGGLAVVCRLIVATFLQQSVDKELERSIERFGSRVHSRRPLAFAPPWMFAADSKNGPHGHPHAPPGDDAFSPQLFYKDGRAEMPSLLHKVLSPSAFAHAVRGETVHATILVDDEPVRVLYAPGFDRADRPGIAQSAYALKEVDRALAGMDRAFLLLLPVGLLGAGWVGILLTNRVLKRMRAMTQVAGHLGSVDFTRRLPVAGYDEFAELAGTFNGLLGRLDAAYQAQNHLLEAQRHFTADASHELKTPLTIIKGRAGVALNRESTDEKSRHTFREIDAAVDTMSQLVQDLLLLARADEGEMGRNRLEMQVAEVLESALEQAALPDSAPITVTVDPADLAVIGNESELVRLVRNLLDNAIRYTPPEGSIRVTARRGSDTEPSDVVVTVTDTGVGIAPEHLAHCGERFYRADASRTRPTGGSGLGLSICQGIVAAHQGTLNFESALGVGTTVTVTLPGCLPE
jgi:signal transduction histidine kinase